MIDLITELARSMNRYCTHFRLGSSLEALPPTLALHGFSVQFSLCTLRTALCPQTCELQAGAANCTATCCTAVIKRGCGTRSLWADCDSKEACVSRVLLISSHKSSMFMPSVKVARLYVQNQNAIASASRSTLCISCGRAILPQSCT